MKSIRFFFAVFLTVFFFVNSGSASALVLELSLEELSLRADRIATGTVSDLDSRWESDGLIYTYVTIHPDEHIKGSSAQDELTVKVPGGSVGGITLRVADTPRFATGERVLVFLEAVDGPVYRSLGGFQGKQTIRDGFVLERGAPLSAIENEIRAILTGEEVPTGLWGRLMKLLYGPRARARYPLIELGPQAADYVYTGQRWPEPNPMGEDYRVNPTNNDGVGAPAVLNAVNSATGTWSSVSPSDFQFHYGTTTGATNYGFNFANEIVWRNEGNSPTLATAYWWIDDDDLIVEADMVFNDYHTWTTAGSGGYDIETVALHELGHWLSLGHSSNPDAVMYAHYGGVRRSLHQDDIDGINAIYVEGPVPTETPTGTGTNPPPPEPTSTPTATATPTVTLTDTPTATSTATPSPTSTATATSAPTSAPTNTPTSTSTEMPTPTATRTSTPSSTSTWTATCSPPSTSTSTSTSTPTETPTPTQTRNRDVFLPLVLRHT